MSRAALALVPALALAPAARGEQDAGALPFPPWLHGAARYKLFAYPDAGRQRNDFVRNQIEADLDATPSFEEWVPGLRAEALFRAVWDDEGLSAGAFDDRAERRPIVNFREAFVAWERGPLEVRAGKQIFSWGKADLFNPTDTLNARDYSDLLDSEKIGSLALSARWFLSEAISIEAAWLPAFFIPHRLPPRGERFDLVPPDFPIEILERDLPPDTLASSQYGVRLFGTIPEIELDWALSAAHGFDHWPNLRLRLRRLDRPPFFAPALEPFFKRQDALGGSLARTLGPFEVHAEAAWFSHSERSEDEYVHAVAGANWRAVALVDEADEVFVTLEYASLIPTDRRAPGVLPGVWTEIFRSALLGRARYSYAGGEWTVEGTGALFLHGPDAQVWQVRASYRIFDWLFAAAGADQIAGSTESFFGQFRRDDRFFFFLEARF